MITVSHIDSPLFVPRSPSFLVRLQPDSQHDPHPNTVLVQPNHRPTTDPPPTHHQPDSGFCRSPTNSAKNSLTVPRQTVSLFKLARRDESGLRWPERMERMAKKTSENSTPKWAGDDSQQYVNLSKPQSTPSSRPCSMHAGCKTLENYEKVQLSRFGLLFWDI